MYPLNPTSTILSPRLGEKSLRTQAIALSILIVVGILPTLSRLEFSSGGEQLNVATVLELYRHDGGGTWFRPTLNGELRINKPPLTAWFTALFVREQTVTDLSSADPPTRERAYHDLALETRVPALLLMGMLLIATFELGRVVAGDSIGFNSVAVAGSSLMFLRFSRNATTDVHLALWVVVANAAIAHVIFNGRRWSGSIVAGLAIGLALLSKGPVALVQTILPAIVFLAIRKDDSRRATLAPSADASNNHASQGPSPSSTLPILAGVLACLAIALPWPMAILIHDPEAASKWVSEIFRSGATDQPRDPLFSYVSILAYLMPFSVFFAAAGFEIGRKCIVFGAATRLSLWGDDSKAKPFMTRWRALDWKLNSKDVNSLLFLWIALPIIIMSLVKDKNERYLLPLLGPCAVISAVALRDVLASASMTRLSSRLQNLHWILLATIGVGFPLAGWLALKRLDLTPWTPPVIACVSAALTLVAVTVGMLIQNKHARVLPLFSLLLMLAIQYIFITGYAETKDGRSELKPIADVLHEHVPERPIYLYDPPRKERKPIPMDLPVYANRIVRRVEDLAKIPGDHPVAVVILQRGGEPAPLVPDGWKLIDSRAWQQRRWHAYTRP